MTFFSLADEIERLRDDISILRIHCAFAQLMPWQRGNIAFSYINPTVNIRIIPLTKRGSESLTYSKSEVSNPAFGAVNAGKAGLFPHQLTICEYFSLFIALAVSDKWDTSAHALFTSNAPASQAGTTHPALQFPVL
jgi:hypothetical protein